MSKPLKIFETC